MADPLTRTRFSDAAARQFREAIADAGGVEVFAVGSLDADGRVVEVEVHCRGSRNAVPVLLRKPTPGQVVIHNHPSGVLEASDADMHLAGVYGDDGVGMVITDNAVARALWVVEPHGARKRVEVPDAAVRAFFDQALPAVLPGWEPRPGQAEMALAVLDALQAGRPQAPVVAALEAGTGTGKSLAYLAPAALWAQANEGRVAIATYTIALQGQLAASDLPLLARAGLDVPWAVLQGRGNYVCRRRLEEAIADLDEELAEGEGEGEGEGAGEPALDEAEVVAIRQIAAWAAAATRGSRSELGVPVPEGAWDRIRSDHDQTLRARCPHYGRCFYYEARRDAARARIVVVNQHLLLADLLVKRQTGGDGILPRFDRVIIDEAHHLEDAATSLMGSELTAPGVTRALAPLLPRKRRRGAGALARVSRHYADALDATDAAKVRTRVDTLNNSLQVLRGMVPDELEALQWALEEGAADPQAPADSGSDDKALRVTQAVRQSPLWTERMAPSIQDLAARLDQANGELARLELALQALPEETLLARPQPLLDLRRARGRLAEKASVAAALVAEDPERVQWIARSRSRRGPPRAMLASAPVEVGPALRTQLFEAMETTVLTSATLTVNGRFDHLLGRLGAIAPEPADPSPTAAHDRQQVADASPGLALREAVFPSPFDYATQALLALPRDFPAPDDRRFMPWARRFVAQAIAASGGGAFVLCTSHAMVADLHAATRAALGDRLLLLRQGEGGQRHLLQRFAARQDAVLFGTDTFWEGVSVAGAALRLVIIPRLPFRVPSEPVQQARHERIAAQGQDPFRAFSLPQAVLRLRQGFGRLVRTRTDRGAVVLLDRRVHERWYGRVFLSSLPPARRVNAPSRAVLEHLRAFYADLPAATVQADAREPDPPPVEDP